MTRPIAHYKGQRNLHPQDHLLSRLHWDETTNYSDNIRQCQDCEVIGHFYDLGRDVCSICGSKSLQTVIGKWDCDTERINRFQNTILQKIVGFLGIPQKPKRTYYWNIKGKTDVIKKTTQSD